MDSSSGGRKVAQITEARLSELTPGIRAFIIVRIARLWDTILPHNNEFTSSDFVVVDDMKNAMHGVIPLDYTEEFKGQLQEGHVYKIKMFHITKRKNSHNAVPSETMLSFNSSTQIQEVHNNIDKYPRHYFNFSTMEDILNRSESTPFMTDVIGILTSVTPINSIQISPKQRAANSTGETSSKHSFADKRDIFIKLSSGEKLRVSLWENAILQLDVDVLFEHATKPIIAIAGTTIKSYGGKYLTTSSATKIYIDPEIPETVMLKERYHKETSRIEMLQPTEIVTSQIQTEEMNIDELIYMDAKEIKGKKFRVRAKICKINMRRGWFYKSCSKCTFRAEDGGHSFICSHHGPTTPRLIMRLNLVIEEDTAKLDVIVFGALAEKLTKYELTSSSISKGVQNDQLPDELQKIVNEEYIFTVGLSDQTSDQFMLKYKVFGFSLSSVPSLPNSSEGKITLQSTSTADESKFQTIFGPLSPVSQEIPYDIFTDESPTKKPKLSARKTLNM